MVETLLYLHVRVVVGLDLERDSAVRVVAPRLLPHGRGDLWLALGLRVPSSGAEASVRLRPPSCRRYLLARCPSRHRERLDYYPSQTIHPITSPASRCQSGRRNRRGL